MATLQELLAPQVIFESITNRVKKVGDRLQRFWNVQLGSSNKEEIPGRVGSYDIFDSVRTAASIRAPGAGPARVAPQAVHQQTVTCMRIHEAMPLSYDRIYPLRTMGKPSTSIDQGGKDYIARQEEVLRTKFANTREWLIAGMMRGGCSITITGEKWEPVMSGGTVDVSWQVPASNKTTLDMTGGGAIITNLWSDTSNADIFSNVMAVDSAFWQQHGYPLKHIWLNGACWAYVTDNAGLKARSGSSNVVFESWTGMGRKNDGDTTDDEYQAQIKCLPDITWHIYNGGLELNGTFTKFFPDTGAGSTVFCPEPNDMMVSSIVGTEYVAENEVDPPKPVTGPYFWPMYHREPARVEIVGLDNWFPALRIPKVLAVGTTF